MLCSGLDNFLQQKENYPEIARTERFGYLSNQASTTSKLIQGRIPLQEKLGKQLTALFSPQHGFFSEKQDNMVESDHSRDEVTGLPVFSLYGEQRKPTVEMFSHIDTLLVDLIDVGTSSRNGLLFLTVPTRLVECRWKVIFCVLTVPPLSGSILSRCGMG